MFRFRKNVIISKSNSGVSLVSLLVGLGLLAIFIVMSSTIFKNFYTTKKTISEAQKALDVTGSIIYDVFDSVGKLTEYLGKDTCQNLNIEDILYDIYGCEPTVDAQGRTIFNCDKTNPNTRTFFIPILGIRNMINQINVIFPNNNQFPRPQTTAELVANGMPSDVINRCFPSELASILNIPVGDANANNNNNIAVFNNRLIYQEYFNLILNLFRQEVRFSHEYNQILNIINDPNFNNRFDNINTQNTIRQAINTLRTYNYTEPRTPNNPNGDAVTNNQQRGANQNQGDQNCPKGGKELQIIKNMQLQFAAAPQNGDLCNHGGVGFVINADVIPNNFIIQCVNVLPGNNVANSFKCNNYTIQQLSLDQITDNNGNIVNNKFQDMIDALTTIQNTYNGIDPSDRTPEERTTLNNVNNLINIFSNNQGANSYLSNVSHLRRLNNQISQDNDLSNYIRDNFEDDLNTFHRGEDPFENLFNLQIQLPQDRFCSRTSIHTCFNIQDNNSGSDFLTGTNPTVLDNDGNSVDCYDDNNVNNPLCRNRSSIILEIRAFPMRIDDPNTSSEQNIQFRNYNDQGSLNRVLKMIYILHWTKKIDGQYKYFKTTGSFTMSTSSNLRQ